MTQGAVRSLDRKIRMGPLTPLRASAAGHRPAAACPGQHRLRAAGRGRAGSAAGRVAPAGQGGHRDGLASIQPLADLGVPYAMVLYERFLGRPFAGHRDSVSELVGDVLETAIEGVLTRAGVSFRKTKRARARERLRPGPGFHHPDEFNPQVIIEAKVTEDDGTARDKVTRVQHLGALSLKESRPGRLRVSRSSPASPGGASRCGGRT